jgi:hypothetical protein
MGFKIRVNSRIGELAAAKLTLLVFLTLTAAGLYAAYEILPFYYYYYELQNQMEAAIRVASVETDNELRTKLVYHIRKMDLPVGDDAQLKDALKIERDDNVMRISLPYEEVFSIYFGDKEYVIRRFKFKAYAEGEFK